MGIWRCVKTIGPTLRVLEPEVIQGLKFGTPKRERWVYDTKNHPKSSKTTASKASQFLCTSKNWITPFNKKHIMLNIMSIDYVYLNSQYEHHMNYLSIWYNDILPSGNQTWQWKPHYLVR